MTWFCAVPEEKSSLHFSTTLSSSICWMLTLIPVSSWNGVRFAAMAADGEVFSEMKLMVVPLNCFQGSPPLDALPVGVSELLLPQLGRASSAALEAAPTSRLRRENGLD